ncbi:cation:dicarboxylate symporter family transporter, partial [Enterococcus faecium]
VFSVFFGVAVNAAGAAAAPLVKAAEALAAVMLKITDYVMRFAPFAVFAAIAAALTEHGPGVIGKLAYFMGSVYLGLATLWVLLLGLSFLLV